MEEYGVKLTLDLKDFNAKIEKAQQSIKKVEDKAREIKVTGVDGLKKIKVEVDTKGIEEAEKKIKSVSQRIKDGDIKITGLNNTKEDFDKLEADYQKMIDKMEAPINPKFMGYDKNFIIDEPVKEKTEPEDNVKQDTKEKIHLFTKLKVAVNDVGNAMKKIKFKSNIGSKLNKSIKMGVSKLKHFAMALFGVRSAFSAVTRAVGAYMRYDSSLQESMQQVWAGFGSFLAPALEFMESKFKSLLSYVNAVVKALTGIDFVARANAKSIENQNKAMLKSQKMLGGFDEIHNIKPQNDVPQIELKDVEAEGLNKILIVITKIREVAKTLFTPIAEAWEQNGPILIKSMTDTFFKLKGLAGSVFDSLFEVWTNGTAQETISTIMQGWDSIFNIIGNVSTAIENAWDTAGTGTEIIQNIADIFEDIYKYAVDIIKSIEKWTISESFQNAIKSVLDIINGISKITKDFVDWVSDMYDKYVKPVLDDILNLLSDTMTLIGSIWKVVQPVVMKIWGLLKIILEPAIKNIYKNIDKWTTAFDNVIKFLTDIFQGNWESVWNTIKSTAKSGVNGIIEFFNGLIDGLNNLANPLKNTIKSIAKAFGKKVSMDNVKIPHIPYLNIGTDLVKEDGMAYLHQGEKVVPADVVKGGYTGNDNKETNELLRDLIEIIDSKNYNPHISVDQIGKANSDYIRIKSRILGEV